MVFKTFYKEKLWLITLFSFIQGKSRQNQGNWLHYVNLVKRIVSPYHTDWIYLKSYYSYNASLRVTGSILIRYCQVDHNAWISHEAIFFLLCFFFYTYLSIFWNYTSRCFIGWHDRYLDLPIGRYLIWIWRGSQRIRTDSLCRETLR